MARIPVMYLVVTAMISQPACREGASSRPPDKGSEIVSPMSAPGEKEAAKRVESITFVGQKDACDCTHDRIKGSWQALQNVLKDGPEIPVSRLQLDVVTPEVDRLIKARPLMVPPGIYFLDEKKQVVALLQGEVDERQIAELLQ